MADNPFPSFAVKLSVVNCSSRIELPVMRITWEMEWRERQRLPSESSRQSNQISTMQTYPSRFPGKHRWIISSWYFSWSSEFCLFYVAYPSHIFNCIISLQYRGSSPWDSCSEGRSLFPCGRLREDSRGSLSRSVWTTNVTVCHVGRRGQTESTQKRGNQIFKVPSEWLIFTLFFLDVIKTFIEETLFVAWFLTYAFSVASQWHLLPSPWNRSSIPYDLRLSLCRMARPTETVL